MKSSSKSNKNECVQTEKILRSRVEYWARKLKVQPTQIRIQMMRRKWASCSPKGWISFNRALIKESRSFQDYAIIHELLHLEIPNHGKLFKSMMNIFMPNLGNSETSRVKPGQLRCFLLERASGTTPMPSARPMAGKGCTSSGHCGRSFRRK